MGHIPYRTKLKRLGSQLSLREKMLKENPLVNDKMIVLQNIVQALRMQTEWRLAGPLARLVLSFQFALHAQEIGKSQTGFIGPAFDQWQKGVARLMHINLSSTEKESSQLLLPLTEVIAIGCLLINAHLEIKGQQAVPQEDPAAAQRAALLYRELGLIFLLGSGAAGHAFRLFAKTMGCKEENQKRVADIGMSFVISLLILTAEENFGQEDFLETMLGFLKPTLLNVEQALRQAQAEKIIEESVATTVLRQLQIIRELTGPAIEEPLKKAFESAFEACGVSPQAVKHDLKHLKGFCTLLIDNFNHIFYQNKMMATTIIQAA